jgi:hypothetical protein
MDDSDREKTKQKQGPRVTFVVRKFSGYFRYSQNGCELLPYRLNALQRSTFSRGHVRFFLCLFVCS